MDGRPIIAGRRLETGEHKESLNPATLESLGVFHLASSEECRQAVEAAQSAFPVWRDMPQPEKRRILLNVKQGLLERADEVARIISQGGTIPLFGDGSSRRDYTYVDDIVDGVISSIDRSFGFEIINLGGAETTRLADLVHWIAEELGTEPRIDYLSVFQ